MVSPGSDPLASGTTVQDQRSPVVVVGQSVDVRPEPADSRLEGALENYQAVGLAAPSSRWETGKNIATGVFYLVFVIAVAIAVNMILRAL